MNKLLFFFIIIKSIYSFYIPKINLSKNVNKIYQSKKKTDDFEKRISTNLINYNNNISNNTEADLSLSLSETISKKNNDNSIYNIFYQINIYIFIIFMRVFSLFIDIPFMIYTKINELLINNKEFQIRGFSLANFFLILGLSFTFFSFKEYFSLEESYGISSLGFIYGLPIALIGSALKYAEILPVKINTDKFIDYSFKKYATPTMKQIVKDTTRHIYGNNAHLDDILKKLNLVSEKNEYPILQYITINKEEMKKVSILLVFESINTPFRIWNEPKQIEKFTNFFGPNITCQIKKIDKDKKWVGLKITNI